MLWLAAIPLLNLFLLATFFSAKAPAEDGRYDDATCALGNARYDCHQSNDARREELKLFGDQETGAKVTLAASLVVEIMFLVGYISLSTSHKRYLERLRSKPLLPDAPISRELTSLVDKLAADIGVAAPEIHLARRDKHSMPSVAEDSGGSVLVLPMGFLTLFRQDPAGAQAVLAHEIGHIKERDTWIFHERRAFSTLFLFLFAPALTLLTLISTASQSPVTLSMVPAVATFWTGVKSRRGLRSARLESELRADRYGCVYADGHALVRVLQQHLVQTEIATDNHPSPVERVASARAGIAQLENPPAAITEEQAQSLRSKHRGRRVFRPGRR